MLKNITGKFHENDTARKWQKLYIKVCFCSRKLPKQEIFRHNNKLTNLAQEGVPEFRNRKVTKSIIQYEIKFKLCCFVNTARTRR